MSDGKIGKKGVGRVSSTQRTKELEQTAPVDSVAEVQKAGAVGKVDGAQGAGKRRATRVMTLAEREELFSMVSEEAKKLFPEGAMPDEQREIIEGAVKMAIDSGLLPEEEEDSEKSE